MTADVPSALRWQVLGPPLVRAPLRSHVPVTEWPDPMGTEVARWVRWLWDVRATPGVFQGIEHASPDLAARVETLCDQDVSTVRVRRARKVTASVLRYVLRGQHRPTPFGLFAGIAPAVFADRSSIRWASGHRAVAAPDGEWIADAVIRLEACGKVRAQLSVVINNAVTVRKGRLVIPQHFRPGPGRSRTNVEHADIGFTDVVRLVMETARRPLPWSTLVEKLSAEHPDEPQPGIEAMLGRLIETQALLTNAAPPATEPDPLGHLLRILDSAQSDAVAELRPLRSHLAGLYGVVEAYNRPRGEDSLQRETRAVIAHLPTAQPLNIDVRANADVALPQSVARVAEHAARLLTVLSPHPGGLPWWREFRDRFSRQHGGKLVPLGEVVNSGDGDETDLPPGFSAPVPEETTTFGSRDRWLLEQAQRAALDGQHEIDVDELVADLKTSRTLMPPAHTELNLRVESTSRAALDSGRFRVAVLGASRSALTMAGRFATLSALEADLAAVITRASPAVPVQLSFPPQRARSACLIRSARLFDHVLHVAEHPPFGETEMTVDDLAVGCDENGLFLWSHRLGGRIEPVVPHALNLRYAPPLVRFLAELPRAGHTVLTAFDWGSASHLPFLPRVRSGRIVLAPARWRVKALELPPRVAPWAQWQKAWAAWAERRKLPDQVELGQGDQRLRLDLAESAHLFLLRSHLGKEGRAVLTEAPTTSALGWCDGRPHEIVVQLARQEAS